MANACFNQFTLGEISLNEKPVQPYFSICRRAALPRRILPGGEPMQVDPSAKSAATRLGECGNAWDTCVVPTLLRSGPYRVYFYTHEANEPPHVHVDRDDYSAKFWLDPVALARNLGFSPVELRKIQRLVSENRGALLEKWYARFGR